MSSQPLLLQRLATGDQAAVRECIDRYGGLVWSLARRLMYNEADAEEAVQEIFVEVWKNAYRYDPGVASETAFVAMLARRRLIDRRRRLDRRPGGQQLHEASGSVEPEGERAATTSEASARAARALERLSEDQQRVLRLSIFQGLSHERIARSLSMPLGTVKTHARRGLIRIREMLRDDGDAPAGGGRPGQSDQDGGGDVGVRGVGDAGADGRDAAPQGAGWRGKEGGA